jgi:DNA-binding MarR family transcriptional regulator
MQKEGLIIREADKKDERIMLCSLSSLGKEKAEIVENTWIEIEKEYQEILDQEEQMTLRRILFKILEKYDHVEIESKED